MVEHAEHCGGAEEGEGRKKGGLKEDKQKNDEHD